MLWMLWRTRRHLLSLVVLASTVPAGAQVTPPVFQFSFSNPGARSLGFGGAFTALADDATAAFANPAGLVQLARPEVSVEVRRWDFRTPVTIGGRINGEPTGIFPDDSAGIRTGESSNETANLSFLSVVYPWNKWSFAVYHHQLASFELTWETEGFFGEFAPDFPGPRLPDIQVLSDFSLETDAVAVGYRFSEALSIGVGLSHIGGHLRTNSVIAVLEAGDPFGPASFAPERVVSDGFSDVSGSDVTINAGFVARISRQWTVGGFYRQGPRLDLETRDRAGPANPVLAEGANRVVLGASVRLPAVYGLGARRRFKNESLTVGLEWDHIEYSAILDSLDSSRLVGVENDRIPDADELHLGAEYVFLRSTPVLALRGGVWLDPDHRLRSQGDEIDRALFQPGDDQVHYAIGAGVAFPSIQIDLGIDLSDEVDTASVSAIYSF